MCADLTADPLAGLDETQRARVAASQTAGAILKAANTSRYGICSDEVAALADYLLSGARVSVSGRSEWTRR